MGSAFDIVFPWRRSSPAPAPGAILVLTRRDIVELLDLDACIAAVEQAFRMHGDGGTTPPAVLSIHVPAGGFHVKAGVLALDRPYFAAKTNANFPDNPTRSGLPTIQGVIVLADADRGMPLAVLDSAEITALRAGAATAVAARYLARPDARTAAIVGCGVQGRVQLRALLRVRPIELVRAVDRDRSRAEQFAREMAAELGLEVRVTADVGAATLASDVVVTCTTSRTPILWPADVSAGAFIAAVGADNPEKQELAPALFGAGRIVVDVLEQAATIGDLHHAIAAGVVDRAGVATELGAVVAGKRPGRTSAEETIVFDSTGMALQDVAAAAAVYANAVRAGRRLPVRLAE